MSLGDVPPDFPLPPAPTAAVKLASARQTSLYRQLLDSGVLALAARGPLGGKGVAGIFGPSPEATAQRPEAKPETAEAGESGDHVDIPEGFEPATRETPESGATLYRRRGGGAWAMRLEAEHANPDGQVPGSLLVTLAEQALHQELKRQGGLGALTTVSLSADFSGRAGPGQWLEAQVEIQKPGPGLAFASAYLIVGSRRLARISGVFVSADD